MTGEIAAGHPPQLDFDSLLFRPDGNPPVSEAITRDAHCLPSLPAAERSIHLPPPLQTPNRQETLSEETSRQLSAARAARLRRIVRDGEEIARRLDRLREDLHREIPESYRSLERGSDRAADLLSDIRDAFDRAAFFAKGQAKQAADRLTQAEQPLRFMRPRTPPDERAAGEGTQPPPLWKVFASGQGNAPDEDTDHHSHHEEPERQRPPWTNL